MRTSRARWGEKFADAPHLEGFFPCRADPRIWMRSAGDMWERTCAHVDDLATCLKDPQAFFNELAGPKHNHKVKGVGPIKHHLGGDFERDKDGTLSWDSNARVGGLLCFVLTGVFSWSVLLTLVDTTGFSQGFVAACCRGCEGFSRSQVHQFVSDLVVAEDHHQTTLFAPREGMLKGKWGITTIAASGRPGGASPQRMERASRNSCAESSVPLTVEGRTESHTPVSTLH